MPHKQTSRKQPAQRRPSKRASPPARLPEQSGAPGERSLSSLAEQSLGSHSSATALRQAGLLQAQQAGGNQAASRLIQTAPDLIQRDKAKGKAKKGGTGGKGPGKLTNAKEVPYDVSGATLNDLTGQLHQFGGFGAEYKADLTIKGKAQIGKTKDKRLKITVKWQLVDVQVQLPKWTDYDQACPAAQAEWDRFMAALRAHEQAKHVDMAEQFIKNLSGEDVEIVGDSPDELQTKLEAKQVELGDKLQADHDACGHGTGNAGEAVLNPDAGICDEAEEQSDEAGTSSGAQEFGDFLGDF